MKDLSETHAANKQLIASLSMSLYDFDPTSTQDCLNRLFKPDALLHLFHPFGDLHGPQEFYNTVIAPFYHAFPDFERREYIRIAGSCEYGRQWVGCAGYYTGSFVNPWINIPPSGHLAGLRYHEFFAIENNQIVEMQAIWDIPELMQQANAWPMAPSLGRELMVPGPASNDGIVPATTNAPGPGFDSSGDSINNPGQNSCQLVLDMLQAMSRHPSQGGPEVMQMERYWHPGMNWYGPSGIGSVRGIASFRHRHQIPFLRAMPDRGKRDAELAIHVFGDAAYVGATGWPDMCQTLSADGWLGLVPSNTQLNMKSLDFWRLENGKIRENWSSWIYLIYTANWAWTSLRD